MRGAFNMNLLIIVSALALIGFVGMPVLRFIFKSTSKLLWFALQGIIVLVLGSLIYKFGFAAVVIMILSVPFILYGVGYLLGYVGYSIFNNIRNKWALGNQVQSNRLQQRPQGYVNYIESDEDDDFDMSGVRGYE